METILIILICTSLSINLIMVKQYLWNKKKDNNKILFDIMIKWKKNELNGNKLCDSLKKRGYNRIAIYGMGDLGKCVCEDIKKGGIDVAYGIDMRAYLLYYDIPIKNMDEAFETVDAILVTAIGHFDEIKPFLEKRTQNTVISLEELL